MVAQLDLLGSLVLHFMLESLCLWCALQIAILYRHNSNEVLLYRAASLCSLRQKKVAFKLLGKVISGPVQ